MKRSGFFVSLSAAPTCQERRLDGMGESRVREIRLPGLTSGDWKRSNGPNSGPGSKRKPPDTGCSSGPTATAPVVDSTRWKLPVGDEDKQVLAIFLDDPEQLAPLLTGGVHAWGQTRLVCSCSLARPR